MDIVNTLIDYLPIGLVVIDVILLVLVYCRLTERYFLRPVLLVPLVLIVYTLSGTLNLAFFQEVVGWYIDVNALDANRIALLGTFGLLVVVLATQSEPEPSAVRVEFQQQSLLRWIVWGTLIGGVFNVVNFASIGGIPIFWKSLTGFERFDIADKMPFAKFMTLNSTLLTLNVLYMFKRFRPRLVNIICTTINLIIAAGIGSRHFIFLPLIIGALFLMFRKSVSTKAVVASLAIAALMMVALQVLRGDDYGMEVATAAVAYGGEYRDYVLLRDYFSYTDYQYGATMLPMITNAVPKQLFSIVGLNKEHYSIYSAYIAQDLWGTETGIRTGIWGELFMNWGDIGIVLGLVFFGYVVSRVDRWLILNRNHEPNLLFLSFLYSLVVFSIIGSWATIGDTLEVYGVLYFAISRMVVHKRVDMQVSTNDGSVGVQLA